MDGASAAGIGSGHPFSDHESKAVKLPEKINIDRMFFAVHCR
jgi:hypothetical protein